MTTIATRYGPVDVVSHVGRDPVLDGDKGRLRSDRYELAFNGRTYTALAGVNWDSPFNREWRIEHIWRHDNRKGSSVSVLIGKGHRAWHAIEDALHEHRKAGGYGQPPEENLCRS